jgi:hypothetical protein
MDLVSGLQDGLDENRALISVLKHGALSSSASSLVSTHTLYHHDGPIANGAAGVFSFGPKRAASNSTAAFVSNTNTKTQGQRPISDRVCARRQRAPFNPLPALIADRSCSPQLAHRFSECMCVCARGAITARLLVDYIALFEPNSLGRICHKREREDACALRRY